MRYLDPKNDLTFKRVFGEHPHLLKSFLNALLPLDSPIETVEYLPAELVPEIPLMKNSIVDVRCVDQNKRQFVVEMQMIWTDNFKHRVLFNASKVYVKQLEKGIDYSLLKPVYALSLVNEIFEHNTDTYYHHYKIVHQEHSEKVLDGLEFVFVELPKFVAKNYSDKKMQVLWLQYLNLKENETNIPHELLENENTKEAVELLKESSYTSAQLLTYEKYWDGVSIEKTLLSGGFEEGKTEGKTEVAKSLKTIGIAVEIISKTTGLTIEEIEKL